RENFVPSKGKYTLIEICQESEDEDEDEKEDEVDSKSSLLKIPKKGELPSKLDPRTQLMIKLIFNDDMFRDQMENMNLDVRKMPLGKLSKTQILKGLNILLELEKEIKKSNVDENINPLDAQYKKLECDLERIDNNSEEFKVKFALHDDISFRKLLWHGTNVAVVAAILKDGLRIMPHSGGLLVFFGEFENEKDIGFMFLTEVALGKMKFITSVDCSLTSAPDGYDSIVARGQMSQIPKKTRSGPLKTMK
ncbi:Poly [ADP-ribose] polymerase 2, partial [Armadillidium vulgare]